MEFFHKKTNFPFMHTRRIWYALSAVLMIGSLGLLGMRGLNLAVDFTGGAVAEAAFTDAAPLERIRTGLVDAGLGEATVTNFGSSREVSIRLPPNDSLSVEEVRERVSTALTAIDAGVQIQPIEFVGPQVGVELRNAAIWALLFTFIGVSVYIIFSFHTWRLSAGAALALMHDPILIIGWFALSQTPFDLAVIAALLATVGYSLNDTIIIFDRIRERFEANRRLEPLVALDQSINQTLSRTIMTKVTTLIVVVALLLFGGDALKGFSEALVIGILAGTYSSIYISSAVALDLGLKAEHVFPTVRGKEVDSLP